MSSLMVCSIYIFKILIISLGSLGNALKIFDILLFTGKEKKEEGKLFIYSLLNLLTPSLFPLGPHFIINKKETTFSIEMNVFWFNTDFNTPTTFRYTSKTKEFQGVVKIAEVDVGFVWSEKDGFRLK